MKRILQAVEDTRATTYVTADNKELDNVGKTTGWGALYQQLNKGPSSVFKGYDQSSLITMDGEKPASRQKKLVIKWLEGCKKMVIAKKPEA